MLRVCDHTACENCTESLQFILWSCRTQFAKSRTHPVLSRIKCDTGIEVLYTSENFQGGMLNFPEVPEARLLLFLTEV